VDAGIGTIVAHGAVAAMNEAYRASGVALPATKSVLECSPIELRGALVVAPPSAQGSGWIKRFGEHGDAFASGWMQLRGARRRRSLDRGFVLSDHADWPGLLEAIAATGAPRVIVTHGYVEPLVRWLREQGYDSGAFRTEYGDEREESLETAERGEEPGDTAGDVAAP
jgi:putative mRNA 3-end processing factor